MPKNAQKFSEMPKNAKKIIIKKIHINCWAEIFLTIGLYMYDNMTVYVYLVIQTKIWEAALKVEWKNVNINLFCSAFLVKKRMDLQ